MSNDEPNTVQRERKHAVIYFDQRNGKAFKELAARVRSEGGRTTLVWSDRWKGAENLMMEARAVVIQRGCANADAICTAYRKYAHDVEIHFVDEAGEFEEAGATHEGNDTEDGGDAQIESAGIADQNTEADTAVQVEDAGEDAGEDSGDAEPAGDTVEDVSGDSLDAGAEEPSDPGSDARDRLED